MVTPRRRHPGLVLVLSLAASACWPGGDPLAPGVGRHAATITVPGDYPTIQAAVDAAHDGDVIRIGPGTYTGDVRLNQELGTARTLTLTGAGRDTVIEGGLLQYGDLVTTLSHLTFVGTSRSYGVAGEGTLVLEDVAISGFQYGVYAVSLARISVDSCVLTHNSVGVLLEGTRTATVTNSLVLWNPGAGIATHDWAVATIAHNTVVGNAFGSTTDPWNAGISVGDHGTGPVQNNIVVSNGSGIDCSACSATFGANDVWGNGTNYVNDAAASPDDLSADPELVDYGSGDYHLRATSPCRDAGVPGSVAEDHDGHARPFGAAPDLGAFEYVESATGLVISEVMANPRVEDRGEFVEVVNGGSAPVDLAGLVLSDGDATDVVQAFEGGPTVLAPSAYAVIVDAEYAGDYPIPSGVVLVTVGNSNLGNGLTTSDPITLYEADGVTAIDTFGFPFDPGDGVSVEKVDLSAGDVVTNWRASSCGSSPGAANCEAGTLPPPATGLVISEVMANPLDEANGEYVEVYNPNGFAVDATGIELSDGSAGRDVVQAYGGGTSIVPARGYAVILDSGFAGEHLIPPGTTLLTTHDATIGNGLSLTDGVTLYEAGGAVVMDSYTARVPAPADGVSVEKVDLERGDAPTNWAASVCPLGSSPGRRNCVAGGLGGGLVISEVMANPLDEDTGEFVEIANVVDGGPAIDLAGLRLSDGDATDVIVPYLGRPTAISGGERALVVDAEYAGDYDLPSGLVLVTTADTSLGNNLAVSDPVTLLEDDGVSVIDRYGHPENPGNGVSREKVDLLGGDTPENWRASACALGSSPGERNCVSGAPSESDLTLVITEVMANPLDEATGEFVEVYNDGATPVDASGLVLYDFDAFDVLRPVSGDGLVPPFGYAVIVDRDYAGQYDIPAGVVLLTTGDGALGSGLATTDRVELLAPDGLSVVDGFDVPFDPGNGVSAEKIDIEGPGTADNWRASTCASGSSPGAASCASP